MVRKDVYLIRVTVLGRFRSVNRNQNLFSHLSDSGNVTLLSAGADGKA